LTSPNCPFMIGAVVLMPAILRVLTWKRTTVAA